MSIYSKLAALQKDLKPIKKDQINPHFKSKFFNINSVIDVLKPLLEKHELIVLQPLETIEGQLHIRTLIIDTEDESKVESLALLPMDNNPQKVGSAITYFRRYSLQSMLFLEADDDDANAASGYSAAKPQVSAVDVGGFKYMSGVKNGKPWFGKKDIATGEVTWFKSEAEFKADQSTN